MSERNLQGGSQQPVDAEPLKDGDLMPFGQHRDMRMDEVSPSYLLYILDQDWIDKYPRVKAYIVFNQDSLERDDHEADNWESY